MSEQPDMPETPFDVLGDQQEEETPDQDLGEPDAVDDMYERIEALESNQVHLDDNQTPFPATLNTDGTFSELLVVNGTTGAFDGGRANGTSNAFVRLSDGQGICYEMEDTDANGNPSINWVWTPNPATAAYLVNNTGGGYDVYADTANTMKLASNLTPETQSGLFQWNGTNGRLIVPGPRIGTITGHSGAFPQWLYTLTLGGSTITASNGCETNVTSGTYGNGITITSASGQANSTSCVIQPIGNGAVVLVVQNGTSNLFSMANSAQ